MGASVSASDNPSVIKSAPEQQPTTIELIAKYFPADQVSTAEQIMYHESGGRSWATHLNSNGSTDYGLFQINSVHRNLVRNLSQLLDPDTNVRIAAQIQSQQGWCPWTTAKIIGVCK